MLSIINKLGRIALGKVISIFVKGKKVLVLQESSIGADIISSIGEDGIIFRPNGPDSTVGEMQLHPDGTLTGEAISFTGNIEGFDTDYDPSDIRLKAGMMEIQNATEKVATLSGYTFKWKKNSPLQGEDVGLAAQEVQKVLPTAVKEMNNGFLAIKYPRVIPLLVQALKEQDKRIKELESKL